MGESFSYTVVPDRGMWRITVTDKNGEMVTTVLRRTEVEAWNTVRYLRVDADNYDALLDGVPRKYQS
jgi:hypothetical protein